MVVATGLTWSGAASAQELTGVTPSAASGPCVPTAPVLTIPPVSLVPVCSFNPTIDVGQATATDNCGSALVPSGEAVSVDGALLTPPIPVISGEATLGLGNYDIQWSVTGPGGAVTADQMLYVSPAIQATQSFLVDDRASILNSPSGFGNVVNVGTGITQIGSHAVTGGIESVGAVDILHHAQVHGNVLSESTITTESGSIVSGTITPDGSVVLPIAMGVAAPPPPIDGSLTVDAHTSRSIAPGGVLGTTGPKPRPASP